MTELDCTTDCWNTESFKISEVSAKQILEFIDSINSTEWIGIESFNYWYGRLNLTIVFTKNEK